ncbi:hypothetical protein OH492_17625 [Vibrio chagasii]|nr:hypothetical protein [Vibrio chagasii]
MRINQALADNPSGAGNERGFGGGAVQEETPEGGNDSDDAQSNVVGGAASDAVTGEAAGSGGGSGAGAQAVGGESNEASDGGATAEGNESRGKFNENISIAKCRIFEAPEQPVDDGLDSEQSKKRLLLMFKLQMKRPLVKLKTTLIPETVAKPSKSK